LTPPAGYTARAPTAEDAPTVAELLRETELRDFGEAEADAVELARDWETFDLDRDSVVVCDAAGTAVGYGYFFRRGVEQAIIDIYVHPAHTGRGVGTYLVSELERRSGDVDRIGSGIPASNTAGRTLLEERGYRMVRRFWRRRGLGRALTLEAFGEFHRRGRRTIVLDVDSENLTGATHLYEQTGMRVTREIDAYERGLT
jgi:ribosomal protein S18 acetylase RimI-like enzyme